MGRLSALVVMLAPLTLAAAPVEILKGPIITGVGQSAAWVAWETSTATGKGGSCKKERGTSFDVHPAVGGTTSWRDDQCGQVHHVHLTGMSAGKTYHLLFHERDQQGQPVAGSFTTAPADRNAPIRFVVYGDTREANDGQPQTRDEHEALIRAIQTRERDAAFLIQTGDLALNYPGSKAPERGYAEFFGVERNMLAHKPLFAALGNHDKLDTDEFDAYVNPSAFAHSSHPYYWSFDWGRMHFTFADTFEGPPGKRGVGGPGISPAQAEWLDRDMQDASGRGQSIVVVTHHSPYSHILSGGTGHGGSDAIASVLVPLMLRYHALGVFAGHDHFYERGREGCIEYVVVGSGGAPLYDPDPQAPGVAVGRKQTAYLSVSVTPEDVLAVAKGTEGEVLDTFHMKPADAANCRAPEARGP